MKKKIVKKIKNTHKSILICFFTFLILGIIMGYVVSSIFTRNDTFELIGDKEITLNLNEEYKEEGVKVISFGIDLKDKITIESNLNTSIEGEYIIVYTVKSLKYKDIKRVRYVTVVNGSDNNG